MRKLKTAPITFAQVCVMARGILTTDPSLDNGEWCDRIKDQLVRAGFDYPDAPDAIHAAMRAVERTVHRTPIREASPLVAKPEAPAPETDADRERYLRFWDEARQVLAAKSAGSSAPPENRALAQIAEWRAAQPRDVSYRQTAKGWQRHDVRRIHGDGAGAAEGVEQGDHAEGRDQDADRRRESENETL